MTDTDSGLITLEEARAIRLRSNLPEGFNLGTAHMVAILADDTTRYLKDWTMRCPHCLATDHDPTDPLMTGDRVNPASCAAMMPCPECHNGFGEDISPGETVRKVYRRHGVRHFGGLISAPWLCGLADSMSLGHLEWANKLAFDRGSGLYLVQPAVNQYGEFVIDESMIVVVENT